MTGITATIDKQAGTSVLCVANTATYLRHGVLSNRVLKVAQRILKNPLPRVNG